MADYRKPSKRGWGLPVAITVAGVAILAFTGWRLMRTEGSPVIALTGSPDSWTHKELAEHFDRRGLKLKMLPTNRATFFGPAVFFVAEGSPAAAGEKEADRAYGDKSPDVVYCQLRKTTQEARDEAGSKGSDWFASGRFLFHAPPAAAEKIKAALP
ncbi:unnamed protein product [Gemmataceae bacterium]|nr:unnamed protein product [Gemmataceae bacterium]VTT96574.1 unnamed protein product [Gemmataceae bacterium]